MNRTFAAGATLTVLGVVGYVLGVVAPYPGRSFSITGLMMGLTLLAVADGGAAGPDDAARTDGGDGPRARRGPPSTDIAGGSAAGPSPVPDRSSSPSRPVDRPGDRPADAPRRPRRHGRRTRDGDAGVEGVREP